MKKLWIAFGLLIGLLSVAFAQSVQLRPGDQGPITFDTVGNTKILNHLLGATPTPALSSCGGGTATIVGTDTAGTVVTGTATTSCVITFKTAYGVAPACVVSPASGVLAAFSYVVTTASITVTQTSTAGNTIQYICVGTQ